MSDRNPAGEIKPIGERVAELIAMAEFFAGRDQLAEAAELLRLALKLDPRHPAARADLARIRQGQRESRNRTARPSLPSALWEEYRRRSIDAAHFLGLARLYAHRGDEERTLECLTAAQAKGHGQPETHKIHGQILLRRGQLAAAVEELQRALTLDPFDGEVAEILGLAEYRRNRHARAAAATAQAFLLAGNTVSDEGRRLRKRLATLKRILGWSTAEMKELFDNARESLSTALDRLEWHRERLLVETHLTPGGALFGPAPAAEAGGALELALRLRRITALSELSDDQIFRLSRAAREELHEAGSVIFPAREEGRDLYLVEEGRVRIERGSSYGVFPIRLLGRGEIFGETGLFGAEARRSDAVALQATRLLRLDATILESLLDEEPEIASRLLWCLWRTLAAKLRASNDQLRGIFSSLPLPDEILHERLTSTGERVELAREDKVRVFREQGLSQRDLRTFATFSREKRFPAGSYLFREGDQGDELYAMVEGKVLISKFIPGGGDEALALLGRGEFFGEMALVDGLPRSADARAEGGPVTVLALDRGTVHDLLHMDPASALDFLRLLCRLLSRRLREIDEKWIGWQILAEGDRREDEEAEETHPTAEARMR